MKQDTKMLIMVELDSGYIGVHYLIFSTFVCVQKFLQQNDIFFLMFGYASWLAGS